MQDKNEKVTVTLTHRELVLVRVALMRRVERLNQLLRQEKAEDSPGFPFVAALKKSHDETLALLFDDGALALGTLFKREPRNHA